MYTLDGFGTVLFRITLLRFVNEEALFMFDVSMKSCCLVNNKIRPTKVMDTLKELTIKSNRQNKRLLHLQSEEDES